VTKCQLQDADVILAPASARNAKKQGQTMAKRRSSGISIKTTPPGSTTVIISLIVFILGVIGFIFPYTAILGQLSFWLCLAGYLLLLAGVLMKGL
jgi:VIT1/CCC1 family predicted Fe2+/Mn2+ transporter